VPSKIGEYILARAAELGADSLVMGCYSHTLPNSTASILPGTTVTHGDQQVDDEPFEERR